VHRRTWQKFEQKMGEWFGGSRSGPMQAKNANDIKHDFIHCQCKAAKRHAILTVWREASEEAKKDGKIPVVAIREKGKRGDFLLIKKEDLVAVANQRILARKNGND